ncbi:MAG: DUF4421 family protein [Prevotella sp.]
MYRTLLLLLTVITWLAPCVLHAQEGTRHGGVLGVVKALGTFIDSAAVSGVDRRYITAPEKPWQVMLRGTASQSRLSFESHSSMQLFSGMDLPILVDVEPHLQSEKFSTIGLWVGYRGYGYGYSKSIGDNDDTYFTIGATGGRYGLNFKYRKHKTNAPEFRYLFTIEDLDASDEGVVDLNAPMSMKSYILTGYYLFNGKRFSYAAAYDQSVIQLRSAGSLMLGGAYYRSVVDYASNENADFIGMMGNVGKLSITMGCIGLGYAYNFVPAKGWLINAMLMPMVSVYNGTTTYRYTTNISELMNLYLDSGLEDETVFDNARIEFDGKDKVSNKTTINYFARVSVVYNWQRHYLCAYSEYNNFGYRRSGSHNRLNDWTTYVGLGYRF